MHANRTKGAAFILLVAGCVTPAPEARQPPQDSSQASVRWQPYDTRPVVANREGVRQRGVPVPVWIQLPFTFRAR